MTHTIERGTGPRPMETLRVPPHSIEAEQSVLGGLMLAPDKIEIIASQLQEDDFYRRDHRMIWRAMSELNLRGKPCDAVTLGDWFEANGMAEMVGGASYLIELANGTPSAANIQAYAEIVKDKALRRKLIDSTISLVEDAYGAERNSQELLDRGISDFMQLQRVDTKSEFTLKEAVTMAYAAASDAREKGTTPGIKYPIDALNDYLGGAHDSDLIVMAGRPASGKEQPISSMIKTINGWVRMGDIRVGDQIASVDNKMSFVTGIFPQGIKRVFEFTFADGRKARAGLDHLWKIRHRGKYRIADTREIMSMLEDGRNHRRISIPLASGDFGHSNKLPMHPWLLGLLIGDGCLTGLTPRFSSGDKSIVDRVKSLVNGRVNVVYIQKYDYRLSGRKGEENHIRRTLESLGLWGKYSHEKSIPEIYMTAHKEMRLELIRGLMDSDGYVAANGGMSFATTSHQLAEDFQELIRSVGGICTMHRKENDHRGCYVLHISHKNPKSLVWLERKKARAKDCHTHSGNPSELTLPIVSVVEVEPEACQCITVDHESHLYITDDYVVTHNTAIMFNFANACDVPCGIISAEQPALQVGSRFLSIDGRIEAHKMRNGHFEEEDWPKLSQSIDRLISRKCHIYDKSAPNISDVIRIARKWKKQHGIKVLWVDYLQRIKAVDCPKQAPKHERVGEVAQKLKDLAKDLNIPVFALAQVRRDVERREDKQPGMDDISDSSEAEKEADQIFTILRPYVYDESADPEEIIFSLEKNRHGGLGIVRARWLGQYMRVEDRHGH